MPGIDELSARLQMLEDGYYGDKEDARKKQFFDTYGSRWSNNNSIGLAILNELDARGIDTSAADEAVTQIIDTLRTECNEILTAVKNVQNTAIEQAQKVEEIQNVVSEAMADNPGMSGNVDVAGLEAPPEITESSAGLDSEVEPPAEPVPTDTGAEPPVEPEPAPAEPPAEPVPTDTGAEPEPANMDSDVEPPTDKQVPSDERIKRIRTTLSDIRMKRIKASDSYKPSAGILSACSKGY